MFLLKNVLRNEVEQNVFCKKRFTNFNVCVYNRLVQSYTYPIVFIRNEQTKRYNGFIPDLVVFAEGETMEEVITEAQKIMTRYFELALKYGTEIPSATSLEETYEKWTGYKVMYITANIK